MTMQNQKNKSHSLIFLFSNMKERTMTFLSVCLIFLFFNMKDSTVACLRRYTVKVLMFLLNNINGEQFMNVTYNNMNGII
jgi:hypothetical protein